MFVAAHRSSKDSLCGPASPEAVACYRASYAEVLAPCGDSLGFTGQLDQVAASGISVLLLPRSPAAVALAVVAVVVLAVDAVLRARPASHVSQEVLKGVPALADRNTPATVVSELLVLGVIATAEHLAPRTVFARLRAVRRFAVSFRRRAERCAQFAAQAAARLRCAVMYQVPQHGALCAARAYALPKCSARRTAVTRQYSPAAKCSVF